MIAETYGKISQSGSNLTERVEDQLTGNIFGVFRYLPASSVLVPFLQRAYALVDGHRVFLRLPGPDIEPTIEFWVHDYSGVEPDVRIKIEGPEAAVILIEAKYRSGLSSDDPADSLKTFERSENQLIRQIRALRRAAGSLRKVEIYLTADLVYPSELLQRVRATLSTGGISDVELYWLSWHEVMAQQCPDGTLRQFRQCDSDPAPRAHGSRSVLESVAHPCRPPSPGTVPVPHLDTYLPEAPIR